MKKPILIAVAGVLILGAAFFVFISNRSDSGIERDLPGPRQVSRGLKRKSSEDHQPSKADRSGTSPSSRGGSGAGEDSQEEMVRVGNQMIEEGKTKEAIELYTEALGRFPNDPALKRELGFAYAEDGQIAEAKKIFEERLSEDPKDPDARFGLGVTERLSGNYNKALGHLNEALRVNPGHPDAKFTMAEILTFDRQGEGTVAEKYLAERFYTDLLKGSPDDVEAQNGLAAVYLNSGRADEAVGLWEDMVQKNPDETVLVSNLSEAYLAANRPNDAVQASQKALEIDPNNGDAYFFLGNAEMARGNQQAGLDAIRRAAELEPNNPIYQAKLKELGF